LIISAKTKLEKKKLHNKNANKLKKSKAYYKIIHGFYFIIILKHFFNAFSFV